MGVDDILKQLYKKRSDLSISLREAHALYLSGQSKTMMTTLIKRDINQYLALCKEIQSLEDMKNELEELFARSYDGVSTQDHNAINGSVC